jgi:glycosyltransferase involved in cell wall biosynthesis
MKSQKAFQQEDFLSSQSWRKKFEYVSTKLVSGELGEKTLISVVIPTYGRADLLREALESCSAQKDCREFKIVITDNDPVPDNETERLIRELSNSRILYYKNAENIGALGNFNRCIEMADTEYAVMLNTDDLLHADYLAKLECLLGRYPQADLIIPDIEIELEGRIHRPKGYAAINRFWKGMLPLDEVLVPMEFRDFLLYNPAMSPTGIVYRRQAFLGASGFNPDYHPSGDRIFYAQMSKHSKVFMSSISAGTYRFIDNITLEKEMRSIFILQGYHFLQSVGRTEKKAWLKPYSMGEVFFRLNRQKNKNWNIWLDKESIEKEIGGGIHAGHGLFFLAIMFLACGRWNLRIFASLIRKSFKRTETAK